MSTANATTSVDAALQLVEAALAPPSHHLLAVFIASAILSALSCVGSTVLLLVARKEADFFVFKLRNKYICPHSSYSFLAFNALGSAAFVCYAAVIVAAIQNVSDRIRLHPYAWAGSIWVAPWTPYWFSFCGGIAGLALLPSTQLTMKATQPLLFTKAAYILWNVFCLGMPIVVAAVTIPLAVRLSLPASQAVADFATALPELQELQRELSSDISPNATLVAAVLQLQQAIPDEDRIVTDRWHATFWAWAGLLTASLLIYIPTFLVLIRSLIHAYRPPTSQVSSAASTPIIEKPSIERREGGPAQSKRSSILLRSPFSRHSRSHSLNGATLEKDFAFQDETRRKQQHVLWRTAALFTTGLLGVSAYLGLLCWQASIDPLSESISNSAVAYSISALIYPSASLLAVSSIAFRLRSIRKQRKMDEALAAERPARLSVDIDSKRFSRARDPLEEPSSPA